MILGVLDSSFLVMPLGNDLLVIALSAAHHSRMPLYAALATIGSVAGCLILDFVFREGGEKGLEHHLPAKQFQYVKGRVKKRGGWALALAALAPPPFPFTPFVAGAAAFEYPRRRLVTVIGAARLVRFSVEGALAIAFGQGILKLAKSPVVEWGVLLLVVGAIGASAVSLVRWFRRGRRPKVRRAGGG